MELFALEKEKNCCITYVDVLSVVIEDGFISIKTEDGLYLIEKITPNTQFVIAPEVDLNKSYNL